VHVTYGAMSKQALKIPNKFLIFKNIQFRGFWMTQWYKQNGIADKEAMLAEIGELMCTEKLKIKIEKIYPLENFSEAIRHAQQGSRPGKILLKLH
jgi:trans-2-enoyl-CoA reductase